MYAGAAEINVLPAVPPHALSPVHSMTTANHHVYQHTSSDSDLPRSASYTHLPDTADSALATGIKRTFSENVLAIPPEDSGKPVLSSYLPNKELLRRASKGKRSRLSIARFTIGVEEATLNGHHATKQVEEQVEPVKSTRGVAGTFRSLARKSWISSSRSPSPAPKENRKPEKALPQKSVTRDFAAERAAAQPLVSPPPPAVSRPPSRSARLEAAESATQPGPPAIPRTRTPQPQEKAPFLRVTLSKNRSESSLRLSRTPSIASLKSQSSSDRFRNGSPPRSPRVPPLPSSISSDKLSASGLEVSRKKDPLWGIFRALEGEFQKFQTKSSALKANVIRTALLPFLEKYRAHPSNKALRAEDLDRRVMILNKWWIGLLEVLNGRNGQSIFGTDRPAFLDGVTGIMMRPEWRLPPFPGPSPTETPGLQRPQLPISRSTTSLESGGSDFLTESIFHNVRNIFVQNLLSQMAFIVDRMSMRTAPASLVAFCGKTCAYAFFFCPGVADLLVRLWHVSSERLRRILTELGVPRGSNLRSRSREVAGCFPPPVRTLAIRTHAALVKHLQHRFRFPLGTAHIRWYGPWTGRWSGRDSDLLFVFVKNYHILVSEFLPAGATKQDRANIPGLVPIHAQVLAVLETTLYRQAGQTQGQDHGAVTIDDENPDTTASLPLTIANANRSMAENRLVMLLRDLLADTNPLHRSVRTVFAESFDDIVKAAARKISIYNSDACFVLCDFMEEVLVIMSKYHHSKDADIPVLDWPFWLQVCQQMLDSQNSLTQVRLFAFLYSTWNIFTGDPSRRESLSLDWLLEPRFFQKFFSHWCPMVRAYYHRLLCWRLSREDSADPSSDVNTNIYGTFSKRLTTTYQYYLFLISESETISAVPPSSAPCTPAPGRRLLIVRNDSAPNSSAFTSFDKVVSQIQTSAQNGPYKSHSSVLNSMPSPDSPVPKKNRWSLSSFGKLLPFGSSTGRPGEVTPPPIEKDRDPSETRSILSSATRMQEYDANSIFTTDLQSIHTGMANAKSRPATPPHQPCSFKFSLEYAERPARPTKNRRLTAPQLPNAAQVVVNVEKERLRREAAETAFEAGESGQDTDSNETATPSTTTTTTTTSNTSAAADDRDVILPLEPPPSDKRAATYAGRALAEWAMIVSEHQNFLDRRREEGVPSLKLIETPTLGVESFRMAG